MTVPRHVRARQSRTRVDLLTSAGVTVLDSIEAESWAPWIRIIVIFVICLWARMHGIV